MKASPACAVVTAAGRQTFGRLAYVATSDSSTVQPAAHFDNFACQRQKLNHLHPSNILVGCGHRGLSLMLCRPGTQPIPKTDAAYPEIKAGPLRLARHCNGVILTSDRGAAKLTKKGAQTEVVPGLS